MNVLMSFLNALGSLLPAVIVFGVLIIVHEWGHFIACRLSKIRVDRFSIGFGPELFHWQSHETRFSVALLPLGGFVSPAGEEASKVGPEGPRPGDFLAAPVGARIFVVIAGVAMNYLLAFVLFWAIFLIGRPLPGTVVGSFVPGYPAEASLLKRNDKVVKVNGVPVGDWKALLRELDGASGDMIRFDVERPVTDGAPEPLRVMIRPKVEATQDIFGKPFSMRRVGILPDPGVFITERYSFFPALRKAWELELYHAKLTHQALFYLITGKVSPKHLIGPLGIIQLSGQAAQAGIVTLLQLLAVLSVSLAVINLLPFPALDGGHLIFLLCELVTRRRLSPVLQERITTGGFVLLMVLMVFVLYNDVANMQLVVKIKNLWHPGGS